MRAVGQRAFGLDGFNDILAKAHAFVAKRPALAEWMDDTNMGNHPSVLLALALAHDGVYNLSPAQAQVELDKLMSPQRDAAGNRSPYYSDDRRARFPAVVKVQVLQQIIEDGKAIDAEV